MTTAILSGKARPKSTTKPVGPSATSTPRAGERPITKPTGDASTGRASATTSADEPLASSVEVLDLAARQRMLNQRHVKLVLARLLGADEPLEGVRTLLQETVCALANGGPAVLKPGANPVKVMLPPAPTQEIHDRILEQEQLLCTVESLADRLLKMDASDPGCSETVKLLVREGEELHKVADAAVSMLSAHFNAIAEKEQAAKEKLRADVGESSQQLNGMAQTVAETSNLLAENTQAQAATISQVADDVESLRATIDEVAKSAKTAAATAEEANRLAAEGGQAVNKNIEAMALINQSSERIAKVLVVVSEIAAQTNLLALNATIEAARAGIHGQAFAVVADEVRKLAQRAALSAKEISGLVKESTQRVEVGVSLSEQANHVIRQIITGVSSTSTEIAAIAVTTESQAATAKGVAVGMKNLGDVTDGNSAATEELAASAVELSSQAKGLMALAQQ
jgi:hypothetical protein